MPHSSILTSVIALVLWSFVMWAWLYATPIPAIARGKIVDDPQRPAISRAVAGRGALEG